MPEQSQTAAIQGRQLAAAAHSPNLRGPALGPDAEANINDVATRLITSGYAHVRPEQLIDFDTSDLHLFQYAFDHEQAADPDPGRRWRSHSAFNLTNGRLELARHDAYAQSANYNEDAEGKQRLFRPIARPVLESRTLNSIVRFNEAIAHQATPQIFEGDNVVVGLHLVSYRPTREEPSWASPMWLHRDEESFVSVVLVGASRNLGGGENAISPGGRRISQIINMEEPLEQLILSQKVLHSVYPMYSRNGRPARRDILIVTFK